jgi:hypothetical protein
VAAVADVLAEEAVAVVALPVVAAFPVVDLAACPDPPCLPAVAVEWPGLRCLPAVAVVWPGPPCLPAVAVVCSDQPIPAVVRSIGPIFLPVVAVSSDQQIPVAVRSIGPIFLPVVAVSSDQQIPVAVVRSIGPIFPLVAVEQSIGRMFSRVGLAPSRAELFPGNPVVATGHRLVPVRHGLGETRVSLKGRERVGQLAPAVLIRATVRARAAARSTPAFVPVETPSHLRVSDLMSVATPSRPPAPVVVGSSAPVESIVLRAAVAA